MSTELIINASLPEVRIAQMEDNEIQDLLIERASGKGIVGNIYKGRVTRVLPGMQAAFVDIGLEKAAFLYVDDVFVHPEIWEEEERQSDGPRRSTESGPITGIGHADSEASAAPSGDEPPSEGSGEGESSASEPLEAPEDRDYDLEEEDYDDLDDDDPGSDHLDPDDVPGEPEHVHDHDDDEEDDEDDEGPVGMEGGPERPDGTQGPSDGGGGESSGGGSEGGDGGAAGGGGAGEGRSAGGPGGEGGEGRRRRRHRRGRRGGRHRREREAQRAEGGQGGQGGGAGVPAGDLPESFSDQMADPGVPSSDRAVLGGEGGDELAQARAAQARTGQGGESGRTSGRRERPEFKQQRGRDKRIKARASSGRERGHADIQDLLKEGQEVIVQVAKDPIATKGARLTCHISLPGRHLVCMPTIDHVGVSRRIERDDERRKLRDVVERNRPKNLGFIVRTASGRGEAEKRIKQDIDYLSRLWSEIRERAAQVTAPALVYEDLNSVLRAIRDWVTEDIDKIVVDSRYHYNEIIRFVSHFMPSLKQKVELYQGDLPIFDTYGISTELARALERKVWLKSGGYIVVDQAEALVAIDVNTGRYVGKKNLEDTILKTNLEAVQEIAYQLRLRNCGGIIILDLIDMEKEENKMQVYRALEEALKRDRARPSILKISELGLVEMTRKRTRDTIVRALCDSCTHCEGKGFVKSKTTVGYEILREIEREGVDRDSTKILVQAHAEVIDVLAIEERETVDQLERRYRKQIFLQAVGDYHPEQFEVSSDRQTERKAADAFDRSKLRDRDRARRGRGGRDRDRGRGGDRERGGGGGDRDRGERGDRGERQGRDRNRDRGRDRDRGGHGPGGDRSQSESGELIQARPALPPEQLGPQGNPEEMNEEDRLAFLRAQAAQDAAIADQGPNGQGRGRDDRGGAGGGQNREGGGGRRGRRGRRGGRFRRGRDRQDTRPRGEGGGGGGSSGGGGGGGSAGGESGGGGGDAGGGGGGGDHSGPPVT